MSRLRSVLKEARRLGLDLILFHLHINRAQAVSDGLIIPVGTSQVISNPSGRRLIDNA